MWGTDVYTLDSSLPAAAVHASDQCRYLAVLGAVDTVDDQAAGRCLVHGAQPFGPAPGGPRLVGFGPAVRQRRIHRIDGAAVEPYVGKAGQ